MLETVMPLRVFFIVYPAVSDAVRDVRRASYSTGDALRPHESSERPDDLAALGELCINAMLKEQVTYVFVLTKFINHSTYLLVSLKQVENATAAAFIEVHAS